LIRTSASLRQRVGQGCRNAMQLFREIQVQGYAGSYKSVSRWFQAQGLLPRRDRFRPFPDTLGDSQPQPTTPDDQLPDEEDSEPSSQGTADPDQVQLDEPLASSHQLAWLLVRDPARLNEQERHILAFLRQEPLIDLAYQLAQHFIRMMSQRDAQEVEAWIAVCASCGVADLEAFALGLQRDLDAVKAAFTSRYSNGPTEGQITRLKLIKRTMYGRGGFELLRHRVLFSPSSAA
jgi:transposase